MTRDEARRIVTESLYELFQRDMILLRNDVSERAITHKLAEYIQQRIPDLNVDCEYNRNITLGERSPKYLQLAAHERQEAIGTQRIEDVPEEVLRAYSTLPDIIVHRRGTNDANTLVIEVKKNNNPIGDTFDVKKLRGFTETSHRNAYHYEHGVFICLETNVDEPSSPVVRWFTGGREDPASDRN